MKTQLLAGETIVKEDGANHQRGAETVGGRLYLTTQRLIFESHAFNIQTASTIIYFQDISDVEPAWTKFLDIIPLAPNSIKVVSREGQEHSFVVSDRDEWIRAITSQSTKTDRQVE